jgi:hypothetical protein
MLKTITAWITDFTIESFSGLMVRKARPRARERLYAARSTSAGCQGSSLSPARTFDYRYVEGVGYVVGDITCQFNARSAYLRCAINPCGPCQECPQYEAANPERGNSERGNSERGNSERADSKCV